MNKIVCMIFDGNFLCVSRVSNFRKVKFNPLWVPVHYIGTSSCFLWGIMSSSFTNYICLERKKKKTITTEHCCSGLRFTILFALDFLPCKITNFENPSNLNILRLENSQYLVFMNLGMFLQLPSVPF